MNRVKIGLATLLSVTLLTGCSVGEVKDRVGLGKSKKDDVNSAVTTEASQPSATTSAVPAGKFDTGKYQVKSTPINEADTDEDLVRYLETTMLSEYMPLPFEVDPVLARNSGASALYNPGRLDKHMTDAQKKILRENKMLYGFLNSGETETAKATDPKHGLVQAVIRFDDPETAQKVASELYEQDTTQGYVISGEAHPAQAVTIKDLDSSLVTSRVNDFNNTVSYQSFTPHEEYLICTFAAAPVDDDEWGARTVRTAVHKQLPMLADFPSVKTKAGYGNTDEWPKKDPHQIIRYTLKQLEGEEPAVVPGGYGPRGAAAFFNPPKNVVDTLSSTGSVHNANADSWVFRAADEFGAKGILNTFTSSSLQEGAQQYEEPQGVPGSTCLKRTHLNGADYFCNIIVGRYVAQVGVAADNDEKNQQDARKKLSQKTAAQYLILQDADQNYKD